MKELVTAFEQLKTRNSERDKRMREVALVRAGQADQVFKGLFPEGTWSRPIIANLIDVVARDVSEQAGVLPTITAAGDSSLDDNQRTKADKRTKIANYYVASSRLGTELLRGADQLGTYGFVVFRVEPNFKEKRPHIHVENSMGAYYDVDRFGEVQVYARSYYRKAGDLAAHFPEHADAILQTGAFTRGDTNQLLEVVRWTDKKQTVMFIPERGGTVLAQTPNKIGRVPVAIAQRPSLDGEVRGSFDDVLPVYAAKARLALLTMEAVQKSVEAPLALPNDVTQLSVGPDSVIRSNSPEKIRRVNLDVPQFAFAENNVLADEMKLGTRFPQARAGQAEGSIVTGQGVKALMAGFDSQIKVIQSVLGEAIGQALSIAFAIDQAYFNDVTREVSATANGVPYKLKYKPAVDINGNYGVTVEYGLMAGLDPNRALVWGLQARGDKLISRGMLRRNLPISLNAGEEERAIDIEEMRDSLKASVSAIAQAIPQMVMQGQDPMKIVEKMAAVIDERKKGTPLEDAVAKAFKPEPAPKQPEMQPGMPGEPAPAEAGAEMGGELPQAPQGRPAMQELLAGLTGSGNPVLSGRVTRQIPA
jgi:hypothetical protein